MTHKNMILAILVAIIMVASALAVINMGANGTIPALATPQNHDYPLSQVSGATSSNLTSTAQYTILAVHNENTATAQISVTVGFNAQGNLSAFVQALNTPSSLMYRQFVTTSQIGDMFGIPASVYTRATQYFESYGLTVIPNNDRLSMQLTGTSAQFDSAFHTMVQAYVMQYQSNGVWNPTFGNMSGISNSVTTSPIFYAANTPLKLPTFLASYVSDVVGLDGAMATPSITMPDGLYPGYNIGSVHANSNDSGWPLTSTVHVAQYQNLTQANYMWVNDPNLYSMFGANNPYQFLFPSTMHVLTGASNLWSGATTIASEPDLGQGVTVAVIEVGSIPMSWLQSFAQQVWNNPNQITDRLSVISLFGANVQNGFDYGWSGETALDIEYIATMAPLAHIDLIALPNSDLSMFDYAYSYIAQYLTTGTTPTNSVTITSNSYGITEAWALFFGPMYITVENTMLEALNAVGVTNFFASGDEGSNMYITPSIPAMAHGSTSVGGGMLTAESNGIAFPVTDTSFSDMFGYPVYVVPATGVSSFTYWSYFYGWSGTYVGMVGGGFGQSISEQQPWWQNAMDTYSSGAAVSPVISGPAAFNMTIYAYGEWIGMYGGTSFATPITAGEWALIEEQANVAFGTPAMGDINPILFAVHNAYQAGIKSVYANPYLSMTNIGIGFDWAPYNAYAWYEINTTGSVVDDPILPIWYATINNPAGSGWNYLQGLGLVHADLMAEELIGQTPSTHHALMNEPFMIMQVTASGLQSITTLVNGTTYTLQVIEANGQPGGYYTVTAYSGGADNGTYGGGSITTMQTNNHGVFYYTPTYNMNVPSQSASEYGYFSIASLGSTDWAFQPFAVSAPVAHGSLVLGVSDAYGRLQTTVAEVPAFQSVLGFMSIEGIESQFGPVAQVMLNGQPVSGAVVKEISINNSEYIDPTMPAISYAPGAVMGQFLTGGRGIAHFFTDAEISALGGPTITQVQELVATYNGLTSNPVIVYCEPDMGSFNANVHMNNAGTALTGTVTFSGMRYVNYVNISIGSEPGQYVNVSYPPSFYDSQAQVYESGVFDGAIAINFTNLPAPGTPINLSMIAEGTNDISFSLGIPGVFSYSYLILQNPIIWSDPIQIKDLGPKPIASLTTTANSTVTGTILLTYNGSWYGYTPVTGALTISSAAGTSILASNIGLNGTYALNTTPLLDGYYNVTYTVTTGTGLTATASLIFYVDNVATKLQTEITTLTQEVTYENNLILYLYTVIASDNQTIAYMHGLLINESNTITNLSNQITTLKAQLLNLTDQLNATILDYQNTYAELNYTKAQWSQANGTISADTKIIASLSAQLSLSNNTISTLKSQISTDTVQIANLTNTINELNTKVAQLQHTLDSKKSYVPPAWYDVFGGAGAVILAVLVIIGGFIGYFANKFKKKPSQISAPTTPVEPEKPTETTPPKTENNP
jgi:subtilase family serine protease